MILSNRIFTIFFILICQISTVFSQDKNVAAPETGMGVLRRMHQRYYQAPCKTYSFSQKNTHYRNDSVIGHSEWYETVSFPDKFKITRTGSVTVYRNDSIYSYKDNQLVKKRSDSSSLLLLIGGMFYRDFEDVALRFKAAGFDANVISEQDWNKETVYVIGAKMNDLVSNQIWVDKKTLYIFRIIQRLNETDFMDMRFEKHQDWCKGNVETKVSFRRNGKLEQVEEYFNIKKLDKFPE